MHKLAATESPQYVDANLFMIIVMCRFIKERGLLILAKGEGEISFDKKVLRSSYLTSSKYRSLDST